MKKISFSLILKISGIVFLAFAVVLGNEIRLGIDRYIKNTLETDAGGMAEKASERPGTMKGAAYEGYFSP